MAPKRLEELEVCALPPMWNLRRQEVTKLMPSMVWKQERQPLGLLAWIGVVPPHQTSLHTSMLLRAYKPDEYLQLG